MAYRDYYFLFPNETSIVPLGKETYLQLINGRKSFTDYAGRSIKLAIIYVLEEEGRPIRMVNGNFTYLEFDSSGIASPYTLESQVGLKANNAFFTELLSSDTTIDVNKFRLEQLQQEVGEKISWLPNKQEINKLSKIIFREHST
jgi:hypothetical protein